MCIAPCRFRLACTALFLVVTNALELRATPIEERGDAALVERTFSALTGEPLQALEAARSVTSLSPEAKRELGERITAALERAPAQSEVYLLHARLAIDPTGLADLGPALQRTFDGRYDTYGFLNIRTIALGSIEGHEHAVSAAEEIQALIQGASDEERRKLADVAGEALAKQATGDAAKGALKLLALCGPAAASRISDLVTALGSEDRETKEAALDVVSGLAIRDRRLEEALLELVESLPSEEPDMEDFEVDVTESDPRALEAALARSSEAYEVSQGVMLRGRAVQTLIIVAEDLEPLAPMIASDSGTHFSEFSQGLMARCSDESVRESTETFIAAHIDEWHDGTRFTLWSSYLAGSDHPRIRELARQALAKDPIREVRQIAASLLGEEEPDPTPFFERDLGDLASADRSARETAIHRLAFYPELGTRLAEALVPVLESNDEDLQTSALMALENLGEDAHPARDALIRLLETGDPLTKAQALNVLGGLGSEAAPALGSIVRQLDEDFLREDALAAIGAIGPAARESLPQVAALLADDDMDVSMAASGALSAMEAPADDVRSTLETLLADATGSERELAVLVALVQRGGVPPDIVERAKRIVSGADDDDEDEVVDVHEIVEAACRVGTERDCIDLRAALIERGILVDLVLGAILEMEDLSGAIGSDLGPALRRFVPRAEALSRARSLYILAQLDESKPEDVETLATLLDHESNEEPEARWLAADALEILGPRATGATVALGRAVAADPHSDVRWSAAAALGAIGPGARDTVPILVRALDDESMDVVISACRALPRIGHEGRTAIPRLLELLRGDEIERSWRAAYGLGGFGQLADEAVPDLLRFLESENTDARWSAANNLNAIGTRPAEVVPALVAALERETIPQPKLAMIHALASFRPDAKIAAKALIARVEDKDEEEQVRLRALEALGALSNPPRAVVNGLAKALGSPEASVRRSALTAIERIGAAAADAVARLRAVLVEEVDAPDLRWRAADALGAIGPAARECVPDLIAAFESPDRDLRWSVVDALANIAVFDSKVKSIIARALEDEDEEVRAAGERAKEAMGGE